jgi:SAM-dependent methyltransferase
MTMQLDQLAFTSRQVPSALGTACAYDAAGPDYVAYADGNVQQPFVFGSEYSFADREIWRRIEGKLIRMAADGQRVLRVFDAGCGPGTWLRRVVLCARALGFTDIVAKGIDLSAAMVALARSDAACMMGPGTHISFEQGDITEALPFAAANFDLSLCLYGVFNHLSPAMHDAAAAELARVTCDTIFVTVRTVGSLPTIYVDAIDHARSFHQDNDADWMDVELTDGRRIGFPSHLFTSDELRALFKPHVLTTAVVGLDVFHSRFAPHRHWNPSGIGAEPGLEEALDCLEQLYASDPHFIDRAAHILLVGEREAFARGGALA